MVRIRLRRVGAKNQPSYRVVVTDSRSPRDGRFIEKIGFYNPRTEPTTFELDEARALYWLGKGAQPSEAVRRLMANRGTLARYDRLRAGEELESLVAEAEQQAAATPAVDPRTRRDDLIPAAGTKTIATETKPAAAAAEPEVEPEAAEAEVEPEAPEMEAETPDEVAESEVEPEVEAEAETAEDVAETEAEAVEDAAETETE